MLDPDGSVRREYRVARAKDSEEARHHGNNGGSHSSEEQHPPTSDDLSDRQLSTGFTHQALAVRQALLADRLARKRLLVMILHDKLRIEALAISHAANGTTLHAEHSENFKSPAWAALLEKRAELDPFRAHRTLSDVEVYNTLKALKEPQLDKLIDLLTVEALTAHPLRQTELIFLLATSLKVDVRTTWTPDASWLSGYQKCQLSHLMGELRGPVYNPSDEKRKKSELVEALATLFADAAAAKLEDKDLAERVNHWLPANLREQKFSK
jgi:hypothetical protein